jgi:hypothetical protein
MLSTRAWITRRTTIGEVTIPSVIRGIRELETDCGSIMIELAEFTAKEIPSRFVNFFSTAEELEQQGDGLKQMMHWCRISTNLLRVIVSLPDNLR